MFDFLMKSKSTFSSSERNFRKNWKCWKERKSRYHGQEKKDGRQVENVRLRKLKVSKWALDTY